MKFTVSLPFYLYMSIHSTEPIVGQDGGHQTGSRAGNGVSLPECYSHHFCSCSCCYCHWCDYWGLWPNLLPAAVYSARYTDQFCPCSKVLYISYSELCWITKRKFEPPPRPHSVCAPSSTRTEQAKKLRMDLSWHTLVSKIQV